MIHKGKVRDIYAINDDYMLIVTTDRLSAFDVVLPDPIPGKGRVLTQISNFWFARTAHIVPNHLTTVALDQRDSRARRARAAARPRVVVRRLKALPLEAVVRGYLIGSGWKDYQATATVCGIRCRRGCGWPIGCPSRFSRPPPRRRAGNTTRTSASSSVDAARRRQLARAGARYRDRALPLRRRPRAHARHHHRRHQVRVRRRRWHGTLVLIDEVLTPGFIALLARRHLCAGCEPAELRQAVRARLSRDARLEQEGRPARTCRPRSSARPARNTARPSSA